MYHNGYFVTSVNLPLMESSTETTPHPNLTSHTLIPITHHASTHTTLTFRLRRLLAPCAHSLAIKWQNFVASPTWEAGYISFFHASRHMNCRRNLLHDFHVLYPSVPTPFHIDNAGTITTLKSPHPTLKSKLIDVKYHCINENVLRCRIIPVKIASGRQPSGLSHHTPQTKYILSSTCHPPDLRCSNTKRGDCSMFAPLHLSLPPTLLHPLVVCYSRTQLPTVLSTAVVPFRIKHNKV